MLPVEAKQFAKVNISQLFSTAVVNSFTEHNLHKDLNTLTPTILIKERHFWGFLYDCVNDILMLSDEIELLEETPSEETQPIKSGTLILWMVINHR